MTRKRVIVLFGGRSPEHEVSVVSARSVLANLDSDRWDVSAIAVARDGTWLSPGDTCRLLDEGARAAESGGQSLLEPGPALAALAGCDIVFPLIHGTFGEDGTLQGLLEMYGVAYAGCGVAASAIGMDKALMKALFREAGIPQARYLVVRRWDLQQSERDAERAVEEELGYPVFVKPANGGSSVGVSKARSREDLSGAFAEALRYDDTVIVEAAITGQEVECSVLGNEHPEASIVGEIVPDREFYNYDSKYDPTSTSQLNIPAHIAPETAEKVRELACRMYSVMGCEGFARVDFFVTTEGEVLANEINTIPGFTTISMYPKLWEATGLSYSALLSRILDLGLERRGRREATA